MELDESEKITVREDLGEEFVDEEEPDEPEEVELQIESFRCGLCGSDFDTERGRNVHVGRIHK